MCEVLGASGAMVLQTRLKSRHSEMTFFALSWSYFPPNITQRAKYCHNFRQAGWHVDPSKNIYRGWIGSKRLVYQMLIMRFLVTCTIEHINDLFRICIHELAQGALDMIKGNCAQSVVPRDGEKLILLGCYGAHTDQS